MSIANSGFENKINSAYWQSIPVEIFSQAFFSGGSRSTFFVATNADGPVLTIRPVLCFDV
jgi:hypothetical protein